MTTALVDFVYATMHKRVNDPDSPYWLPKILEQIRTPDGHTLSPLAVDQWSLGALTGDQGVNIADTIADAWWIFVKRAFKTAKNAGVPDLPANLNAFISQRSNTDQYPTLALNDVSVDGLPNAAVGDLTGLTPTADGYRGTIRVTTAAYDSHGYQPRIAINGRYQLDQHVIVIDDPRAADLKPPTQVVLKGLDAYGVDWPSQAIEGRGEFLFTVTGLVFDVRLSIEATGTGAGRTAKVTVESVATVGTPVFTLDKDHLTIEGDTVSELNKQLWIQSAVAAFNSPDAATALTAKLSDALNADDFRTQFSGSVTDQLDKALDNVFGTGALPADSGPPPTGDGPLEVYLFDRVRASLNDTGSGFYPPTVVESSSDPNLDPLSIDTIDLGDHQVMGVPVNFTLNDVSISGIADVLVPAEDASLVAEGVDATLRFGRIAQAPITVKASVVATFTKSGDKLNGTMTTTAEQPSVALGLSFSGPDADDLTIGLRSLTVDADPARLDINVHVDGLPDDALHQILNTSEIKAGFIQGVQDGAAQRKDAIAKALTDNARKVIAGKLAG
ncbi:hypothetical protein B7P34_03745 [Streptosporangium nondiastaticum]|uniref:Uncharacterized protein n=1 Tax=Streptosporangium nondiastaticum TaxID=35764 RepID=A0A9X7JUX3_9ACTN|nr:hypothetical protein [Streptosporangium nondiastaticum]PSJ30119.1 hypothetical protein B7P34_03745 [Streptosporangium nondiastaticum]